MAWFFQCPSLEFGIVIVIIMIPHMSLGLSTSHEDSFGSRRHLSRIFWADAISCFSLLESTELLGSSLRPRDRLVVEACAKGVWRHLFSMFAYQLAYWFFFPVRSSRHAAGFWEHNTRWVLIYISSLERVI